MRGRGLVLLAVLLTAVVAWLPPAAAEGASSRTAATLVCDRDAQGANAAVTLLDGSGAQIGLIGLFCDSQNRRDRGVAIVPGVAQVSGEIVVTLPGSFTIVDCPFGPTSLPHTERCPVAGTQGVTLTIR
jgi:hypothetical protein